MASYLLSRWRYAAFDDEVAIDDEVSYLVDHEVAAVVGHEAVVVADQAVEAAVHVVVVVGRAAVPAVAFSVDLVSSVLVVLALIDADFVVALNCWFYQMVELFAFGLTLDLVNYVSVFDFISLTPYVNVNDSKGCNVGSATN